MPQACVRCVASAVQQPPGLGCAHGPCRMCTLELLELQCMPLAGWCCVDVLWLSRACRQWPSHASMQICVV
jgi:hypothetical protein